MSFTCDIIIKWKATPDQLTDLGNALWRWCHVTAGHTRIFPLLDNQALADLIAGMLPLTAEMPESSDIRGVHFLVRDYASPSFREAVESLRHKLPPDGIAEVLVDNISWNAVVPIG